MRAAKTENTIDTVKKSIDALNEELRSLDEAIRGNGKIGLCEQTRILDRRVDEIDRRIMKLEDVA